MLRTITAALAVVVLALLGLFVWRQPDSVQAQGPAPLCDVTCSPDPDSGSYGAIIAARPKLPNARGVTSAIVPREPRHPGDPAMVVLPGSESYSRAIPILSLPGRNGLDLNLTLYYNSRVWTHDSVNATITFNADRDFPSYGFRLDFGYLERDNASNTYILTEADGSKRRLNFTTTDSYDSDDSSYINYKPSTKLLIYKNGTRVTYQDFPSQVGQLFRPIQIKDTNGNFITISYRTEAAKDQHINTITDTLGRVVTFNYDGNFMLSSITQGSRIHALFTWNTNYLLRYNFSPSLTVSNTSASGSSHKVLAGCFYNNATGYSFTYGDWGIVNKIEHKSAAGNVRGYVEYNYPSFAAQLSGPPSWTVQTSNDGATSVNTVYSVTKVSGQVSTFTVTDASGTKTVTTLNTSGTYAGLVSKVEIKNAANTVLRKMDNTWASDTGGKNPRRASVTSTLSDTGQQSKVELTYTTFGNVSEVKEYDYGLVLKRRTATTYLTTSSYTSNTRHILDRPTQVLVKDGLAAIKARTDFSYDLTSPTGLAPAPASHDTANYGTAFNVRGNVTRITRYSNAAAGTNSFARNFTYDIAGNLRTAELDCCTSRSWTYDATMQYAYPITVTTGPVGTQLTTSATYNFASGTLATSEDENNKQTTYAYDEVDRLTTVTLPNNVVLTTAYDDASTNPAVTRSSTANSAVQFSKFDGLGRPILDELRNNSAVVSTTETDYDSEGRPFQSSNPYGPGETPIWSVTAYDDLNRPLTVTPPGGTGSYQYAYSGNVVTITDPAGKQRRNTTDALGRLVKVEEPGFGDGIPGKGTVVISGAVQVYQECVEGDPLNCVTFYDAGSVSITINGLSKSANYNQGSTAASIASALASAINADSGYPVSAGVTGGTTINLTAKTVGLSTNYSLSSTSATSKPQLFEQPSFGGTPSGPNLTGGWNPSGPDTASLVTPMPTVYTYDVLDNLLTVAQAQGWPQGGVSAPSQNRTYNYDSMSRLTSTVLSESSTTNFFYTTAGGGTCSYDSSNVCRRTDARNIISTYSYDGLGRLATVSYSDGTPTVTYTYGTSPASNNNGRLITLADGAGTENYTYDLMGRITNVSKVISGTTYNLIYGYNNANQLTSLTYPSGRVVTQAYDAIGRISSISSGPTTYLSGLSFNAAGQPLAFNYGNGVAATFTYNQRLQLASLRYVTGSTDLLNLAYNYGTQNNGQIKDIKHYTSPGVEDQTKSQNYVYDAWARLRKAYTTNLTAENTWQLEWDYDRFGNRRNQNLTGGNTSITTPQLLISETTNRITTVGYAYDAAGNLTNDTLHVYTYDAEDRIKTTDSTAASYTYSGPMRVKKVAGGTTTVYIFSGTKVLAEYLNGALSKEYVYSGSSLLATHEGATLRYHHPDHLGTRVDSDAAGNWTRKFGHFAFGERWYEDVQGGGAASKLKFTSFERDSESDLDYAMFRYQSSRLGRFMSPDLLAGNLATPQSLNRYASVSNDPINRIDPFGLDDEPCTCAEFDFETGECKRWVCPGDSVDVEDTPLGPDPYDASRGAGPNAFDNFLGRLVWMGFFAPLLPPDGGGGDYEAVRNAALKRILSNGACIRFIEGVLANAFSKRITDAYGSLTTGKQRAEAAERAKGMMQTATFGHFTNVLAGASVVTASGEQRDPTAVAHVTATGTVRVDHPGQFTAGVLIHETFHLAKAGGFGDMQLSQAAIPGYVPQGKTPNTQRDNASLAFQKELEKNCGK